MMEFYTQKEEIQKETMCISITYPNHVPLWSLNDGPLARVSWELWY